jgi:hypothetical protein
MRVGFTGHQRLTRTTRRAVAAAITKLLADSADDDLVGITSLAEGADQIFAFTVLAAGGHLHAVIPSAGYEDSFADEPASESYIALLRLATDTMRLPFTEPSEDAYLAAGQAIVDSCDMLIAVWDGKPAGGKGGTGDIVGYASKRGMDLRIIWPHGAQRNRG